MKMQQKSARVESLESRELLTAVIDLRLPDGSKTLNLGSTSGQTINIDVFATVTGSDATGSNDGFQDLSVSFISTRLTSGSVRGALGAANVAPFTGTGATPGAQADLNGDGSIDVGSTGPDADGYFFARAGSMQTTGGVVTGASQSFKIATLAFAVTSLSSGGETDINVVPRNTRIAAVWNEDGKNMAPLFGGVLSAGAPIRLTATGTTPPPPAGKISGTIVKDLNGDGKQEAGETGLAGVTVYIDSNKNGVKDATEKSTVTPSSGAYSFTGLAAGTYRVREVLPTTAKLISPTAGYYDVPITTAAVTGKNFFDQPKAAVVVTVDNAAAAKTGTWATVATPAGFFGPNYLSDTNSGKGTKSAAFHAALPSAGQYLVYARWPASSKQSAKVPIDIKTATSTTTVFANQQTNGNSWVLLGTFTFDVAKGATVTIRNAGTTATVVADAIQLVKVV